MTERLSDERLAQYEREAAGWRWVDVLSPELLSMIAEIREVRSLLRERGHPGVCEDTSCPECYGR